MPRVRTTIAVLLGTLALLPVLGWDHFVVVSRWNPESAVLLRSFDIAWSSDTLYVGSVLQENFGREAEPGRPVPAEWRVSVDERWSRAAAYDIVCHLHGQSFLGFRYVHASRPTVVMDDVQRIMAAGVPLWFLTLALGAWPAVVLYRYVQRRRRGARGLCLSCGYDLRASGAQCPECGVAVGPAGPDAVAIEPQVPGSSPE